LGLEPASGDAGLTVQVFLLLNWHRLKKKKEKREEDFKGKKREKDRRKTKHAWVVASPMCCIQTCYAVNIFNSFIPHLSFWLHYNPLLCGF